MGKPENLERLLEVTRTLRSPDGCPWDREQTLDSIKGDLIEEAYELIDAIESGDLNEVREELGDLLQQVVFQSRICEEQGAFDFYDVARGIADKLVRRHPHVFAGLEVESADEVLKNWDAIKKKEKGEKPRSIIEGIPRHLPALQKAHQIQRRVARVGFDWPDLNGVFEKLEEELQETREAIANDDRVAIEEELGDLLFSAVNLCRYLDCNPEELLNANIKKFSRRFQSLERQAHEIDRPLGEHSIDELEALWQNAKHEERQADQ